MLGACRARGSGNAAPSIPGTLIAFASNRDRLDFNLDIYVMNDDGTGVTRLTSGQDVSSFAWSPDGSRVLFAAGIRGDIFVVGRDGTELRNLTKTREEADYEPAWSKDASLILFFREVTVNRQGNVSNVTRDVHVMKADGSDLRAIDLGEVSGSTIQPSLIWGPDSLGFAFVNRVFLRSTTGPTMSNTEIFHATLDGATVRNLTNNPADDEGPAWFPDGSRLAFSTDRDGNFEIYTMQSDGSGAVRLTQSEAQDDSPVWSPGGSKIAFVSRAKIEDRLGDAYVMNADGSAPVRIADYVVCCFLSWSADGRRLSMVMERDGNLEVVVVGADGSGLRNLTGNPGADLLPAWQPVG